MADETTGTQQAVVPEVAAVATNLGVQVRRSMMMRSDIGKDAEGRDILYTVLMGNPAMLVLVDVADGKVVAEHPLPDTSGAWAVHVAPDQTVYIGAYNCGLLYRYSPHTGQVTNLGRPFDTNDTVLYPMAITPEGRVYGGSYDSGHLYMYDPAASKFVDLGNMTTSPANEHWIRVTVHDPKTNKLYLGIGNQPQLVEYNIATKAKRDLLPARHNNITAVYDLNVESGRLFCRKETHNPYEYFVLDIATGEEVAVTNADTGETSVTFINGSRGMSPKSPVREKLYYIALDRELHEYDLATNSIKSLDVEFPSVATGYKWLQLKDAKFPGWTLVGTTGNTGEMFKYNLETGHHEVKQIEYTGQPINIHEIETGPDGRIYSGGFLAGNMGIFDPATGKVTHLSGSGQTEGLVFVGNKLYMGVYPTARIFEYDTTKPWNPGSVWKPSPPGSRNPDMIFHLENWPDIPGYTDQDRPFAMAGSEELQKLFVGTVPKNGMLGGALAMWSTLDRGAPEVYWNIVPDQSIVALAYHDGMLYGGTSIYGGMGATPRAREAELFVWSLAEKRIVHSVAAAPGKPAITQLTVGTDKKIWGLAGGVVFAFDPASRKVIHHNDAFPGVSARMRDGSLIAGRDGKIYGAAVGKLFLIDLATRKLTVLASGVDKITQDHQGRLYIVGKPITELYQLDLEKLISMRSGSSAREWQ